MDYYRIRPKIRDGILYWVREQPNPDNPKEFLSADAGVINDEINKGIPDRAFNLPKGSIVFDLGAHLGSYSLPLAKARPDYNIYAFEPEPFNYGLLVRNIIANSLFNITPLQFAIGKETGINGAVHRATNSGTWSLRPLEAHYFDLSYEEPFYVLTLKDAMTASAVHKIDYLKIDVEGVEYEILASTPPSILKDISGMEIEIHNNSELFKMSELLSSNGFQYRSYKKIKNCWDVYK